jgi:hypothetical protein
MFSAYSSSMRSIILFVVALILLSGQASAWGQFASRFVCHEAVKFVWGPDAVGQCLPPKDKATLEGFCDSVYDVMGPKYEDSCRFAADSGAQMHPSLISYDLFNDTENHYDFSRCPINEGNMKMWVCGDGSRPAYDMYERWMTAAESAPDLCGRIYDFCVAASYYADSQSILHQVRYVSNDCVSNIESSIDRCMESGTAECSASQQCQFDNRDRGLGMMFARQKLGESSSTLNQVIANLTERGMSIKDLPYKPKKGVILLANTVDLAGASEFIEYLKTGGVNLIVSDASDFQNLRYNDRILILGGQNSPEGVGAIAASILSQEDEGSLLSVGAGHMFTKDGQWAEGQKVVVLAGNEVGDTQRTQSENRQAVLDILKTQ